MSVRRVLLAFALVAACGEPDAPIDGGTRDAAAMCRADSDCDDGLACNGAEHCVASACVAGTAMHCDDGIACTLDTCSDSTNACVHRAPDADHDGHPAISCVDGHGTPLGDDCDDADPNDFPGNHEVCDAQHHDEDCNPATHGGVDSDADTYEDIRCCNGMNCGTDCDDAHASAHPGATEVCNLIDDDCDMQIDEMVSIAGFADLDRDGYGDMSMPMTACSSRAGFALDGTDCDDLTAARNPGQPEFCDNVDNDCDSTVDEDASAVDWFTDHDGDGFGSAASGMTSSCMPPGGSFVLRGTDCDDANAAVSPGAAEICNAIDDDCNGVPDFVIAPGDLEDDDLDHSPDAHCGPPLGNDCDDRDPRSGPGSSEICDGRDNDCDGMIDEGVNSTVFHRDADGDGWGDPSVVTVGCTAGTGWVANGGDCDDTNAARHPGEAEICDGIDEDCDGAADEGEASMSCAVVPNGMSACVGGHCVLTGCDVGFASCLGESAGCETDVRSDPRHCGTCAPCSVQFSECSTGSCRPAVGPLNALETDTGDVEVFRVVPIPGTGGYVIGGRFTGTLTIGPTPMTSLGGYDGFGAAIRGDGTVIWATSWGGAGDDAIYAMAMPADQSAFIIGGEICNASLCGGPISNCYAFWQRFPSPLAGGCAYAAGISTSAGAHMTLRSLAMEHVAGNYFVYGSGSWSGTATTASLGAASGPSDGFVFGWREVPGMNPTLLWAHPITGIGDETVFDVTLAGTSGLLAVGASTSGVIQFHPTNAVSAGGEDAFVINLSRATGAVMNAQHFGTAGDDAATQVLALANGDYLVGGSFGAGTFPLGPAMGSGSSNVFLAALSDPMTFATRWVTVLDGSADVGGIGDGGDMALASGMFTGALTIGSAGSTSTSEASAYLAALDATTGAVRFARTTTGSTIERSGGLFRRSDGGILWEIEHLGPTGVVGGSTVSSGSDVDIATTVVTP